MMLDSASIEVCIWSAEGELVLRDVKASTSRACSVRNCVGDMPGNIVLVDILTSREGMPSESKRADRTFLSFRLSAVADAIFESLRQCNRTRCSQ